MKKKQLTLFTVIPLIVLLLATSCRKENSDKNYSAIGYWRGNANIIHTAVLNKPDGSARIYLRIFGIDTANATKADGFFIVSGNNFRVSGIHKRVDPNYDIRDTLYIETNLESPNRMSGQLYSTITPEILDCTLRKQ